MPQGVVIRHPLVPWHTHPCLRQCPTYPSRHIHASAGLIAPNFLPPPPVSKNQQCLTAEPGVGSCAHFSP